MDYAFRVSYIIDKLPYSWKDFKHTLKHQKEELTLVKLGSNLRIEESPRVQDNDKPKGNNVAGPSVFNMVEHNNSSKLNIVNDNIALAFMSTSKLNDSIIWHARLGRVYFMRMHDMSKDRLILAFDMDTEKCMTFMLTKITKKPFQNVKRKTNVLEPIHSDLCNLHATPSLGNKKYFVTFIDDAFIFCYVYILHTKDEALDKFRVFKTEVELQQGTLIKRFKTNRGESKDVVELRTWSSPRMRLLRIYSVREVGNSSTATFLREDGDSLLPSFMRRDINSLFGRIASLTRRVCGHEMTHALVEKKGKEKEKYYGKLIADLGNEVRCSMGEREAVLENIIKEFGNAEERAECKKMEKELEEARGVVFKERPNKAINAPVKDEESPSFKPRGSPRDSYKYAKGKKVKFATATLQGPALTWWNTKRFNELALMCPRMVEPKNVKIDAYIRGLSKNIKGEVTSSKPTNLSEVVRMAHKLMKQKLQAKKVMDMEGKKRKWENFQSGNCGRGNYKDNSRHQQNNQKQGNAGAMTTALNKGNAPTGPLLLFEVLQEKNVATGANVQPVWTCYDCGEQGHTRNHCSKKNKPKSGNTSGRAYVIKDVDKQGRNVVTGMFLLNNRYASVMLDSGSDKSFVNTRFRHLIDINSDKLDVSYEVELANGKVVNNNTVLRGC
nr:zinc finger, CCHC-type [Tanacetum cinerariifolium]